MRTKFMKGVMVSPDWDSTMGPIKVCISYYVLSEPTNVLKFGQKMGCWFWAFPGKVCNLACTGLSSK